MTENQDWSQGWLGEPHISKRDPIVYREISRAVIALFIIALTLGLVSRAITVRPLRRYIRRQHRNEQHVCAASRTSCRSSPASTSASPAGAGALDYSIPARARRERFASCRKVASCPRTTSPSQTSSTSRSRVEVEAPCSCSYSSGGCCVLVADCARHADRHDADRSHREHLGCGFFAGRGTSHGRCGCCGIR